MLCCTVQVCDQVLHMSSSGYMMQHFDFYFPSHWDSRANQLSEMHSWEERKGEERTVSSSHTSPLKSVPDHLAARSGTSCKDTTSRAVQQATLASTEVCEEMRKIVSIGCPATH